MTREPIELDYDGEIKTIDKAYTLDGWIEILTIFKDNYGENAYCLDSEHDIVYLPLPKHNPNGYTAKRYNPNGYTANAISTNSDDGKRLQQLGCFWDDELERWCKYT